MLGQAPFLQDMKSEDERLAKFDLHSKDLIAAARLCQRQGLTIPGMMLMYASIDGMAWLYREHDEENTGKDFRAWVDKFWIPESGMTSMDLWSARNALLHEQSSNSRFTRTGQATPLCYREKNGRAWVPLGTSWKEGPGYVYVDEMIDKLESAVAKFRRFIETCERREQILSRCGEWFDLVSVDPFYCDPEQSS
jgi:hypothetical protein